MLDGLIGPNEPRLPRRVLLYGIHGIGKSTFGACAPNPIFVPTEDGRLNDINPKLARFKTAKSFGEFCENLGKVVNGEHEYETVVIDTADWLAGLVEHQVCTDEGVRTIAEIGYGKGWPKLVPLWEFVLGQLELCQRREERGIGPAMWVVLLAHSEVIKVNDPMTSDNYDKYQPALHKTVGPMLMEWSDEVLFARERVTIVKDEKDRKKPVKAGGSGDRVLYTCTRPTHQAKRRLPLPDEMDLSFADYYAAVQAAYAAQDAELGMS